MAKPQPGIFAASQPRQYAIEYNVNGAADTDAVVAALTAARSALAEFADETSSVIAFGPSLYRRLAGNRAPDNLESLATIGDGGNSAPSTQRDLLLWIQGPAPDVVFDQAKAVTDALAPVASCVLEVPGFIYHDSRDLIGFIDGTANPTGDLIAETALVPEGQPGAGGGHMLTQKWVHDLDSFNALPVADQERVIGRTKKDSIELEGDAMPADSHVSRTDVKVDGDPQRLYRRSFPYGTVSEHGLYFLSFACDPARFDIQLRRMFGVSGDGVRDRLIDFSKVISGSYWFAPSLEDLDLITG